METITEVTIEVSKPSTEKLKMTLAIPSYWQDASGRFIKIVSDKMAMRVQKMAMSEVGNYTKETPLIEAKELWVLPFANYTPISEDEFSEAFNKTLSDITGV